MANPTGSSQAFTLYGWESSYGTESASKDKVFGVGQNITINRSNTFQKVRGIGDRDVNAVQPGQYEGGFSITTSLSNPWWFNMLFGTPADAGAGPYTHTWNSTTALPDSFSTILGIDSDTDSNQVLLGCKAESIKLSCSVGETAQLTIDGSYKTETEDSTLDTKQVESAYDVFFFQQGTLSVGTSVGFIDNVELEMTNGLLPVYSLGSRFLSSIQPGERNFNLNFTVKWNGPTNLDDFYGQDGSPIDDTIASQSTAVLTFNNGGAGTAQRQIVVTLTDLYFDSESLPTSTNEVITEDMTAFCKSFSSVVATDNTATAL